MTGPRTLTKVVVFIASPSDVADARDQARRVVERVNRLVAKELGFLLEAVGWEDIPAGVAGRAQEVINEHVDAASIFIGILNKRFGTATGVAESGTEEEYNRIMERRDREEPPPEVLMYFRGLSPEDVGDPGEGLRKVLLFKERISDRVYYKEFGSLGDLETELETALSNWLWRRHRDTRVLRASPDIDMVQADDLKVLAELLRVSGVPVEEVQAIAGLDQSVIQAGLDRLQRHGLVVQSGESYHPIRSTEGFLRIAQLLLNEGFWEEVLRSNYYSEMLKGCLSAIVEARFHCTVSPEIATLLRKLALLSPGACSYLLFGETRLYDNLAAHARSLGGGRVNLAEEIAIGNILHRTLLRYADDIVENRVLDSIDGKPLSGQLVTVGVVAAHEGERAFRARSAMPIMRFRAQGNIEQGQMLSGGPGFFIHSGLAYFHMGEAELAIQEFDKVLAHPQAESEACAVAMNNKGLALMHLGKLAEASRLFEDVIAKRPELKEAQNNLDLVKSLLLKQQMKLEGEQE